jgi:hypothetical protein
VNNYYKPGPATKAKKHWILNPSAPYGKFYVHGNCLYGNEAVSKNNWMGGIKADEPDSARSEQPFSVEEIGMQSPEKAFEVVLKSAGASYKRDAVDVRIVNEVRTGTAPLGKNKNGIIDSQQDVGGWPELKSLPAPADTDADGMPDGWETKNKLNPQDASDSSRNDISKSYTNLEVFLNELVQPVLNLK